MLHVQISLPLLKSSHHLPLNFPTRSLFMRQFQNFFLLASLKKLFTTARRGEKSFMLLIFPDFPFFFAIALVHGIVIRYDRIRDVKLMESGSYM